MTFEDHLEELGQYFLSRNYNAKVVSDAFKRVREIPRAQALRKVEKTTTDREPLVLEYHPSLPSVAGVIRKHWKVMTDQSKRLKRCFAKPSLVAYKRLKNLKDVLIRARVSTKRSSARKTCGFNLCQRLCRACIITVRSTT